MDPQQTPMNPRLDSSVLLNQPASDWAKATENALGPSSSKTRTTESTSPPDQTNHVVQQKDSAFDASAKSQEHIDNFNPTSTVSTPGLQVPGAWMDKPTPAHQMLNDASATFASVGSAVYSALPGSVKGTFSNQTTTNKSPIETPTSHTTTTPAQNIAETLQSTFTKVSDASVVAARTATAGVNAAYGKISGMDAGMNKSSATMPANETRTLPSQELEGQQPMSGPMDGVGALPGGAGEVGVAILPNDKSAPANTPSMHTTKTEPTFVDADKGAAAAAAATVSDAVDVVPGAATDIYDDRTHDYVPGKYKAALRTESHPQNTKTDKQGQLPYSGIVNDVGALPGTASEEGVAILPEEKANPNPLVTSQSCRAKKDAILAEPYTPNEPYSNLGNAVQQPPKSTATGIRDKAEEEVEVAKGKAAPSKSSSSELSGSSNGAGGAPKKSGLMGKLKAQSKIISGKMLNNPDKVAEGQALKSGTHT